MAFPVTPLDVTVELQLAGVWTDITGYAFVRDEIIIRRGRSAQSSTADPSSCTVTLNNLSGRFSPRNPAGPYYGSIGRNTPLRVSVNSGRTRFVNLAGSGGAAAYTPDSAAVSITGDLDVRADLWMPSWRLTTGLLYKYGNPGQRSWFLQADAAGTLTLYWTADGTTLLSATSTAAVPLPTTGRKAVRATLDVNNGAGGRTVTFYTAASGVAGPWTQLGDPVVQAGTTSVFDSTAAVAVDAGVTPNRAEVYAVQVRNGIGGTVVANPDFTAQADGATSFADSAGATWFALAGMITNRRVRFVGEVASWPQQWDPSGNDAWVSVEANGILRRTGQGASALRSTLYRKLTTASPAPVAYWPAEDGPSSRSIASPLPGVRPMTVAGVPGWGDSSAFAAAGPVLTLGKAALVGVCPAATPGQVQVRFLLQLPDGGATSGAVLAHVFTTGTAYRWTITYTSATNGSLTLTAADSAGTNILTASAMGGFDGLACRVSLELWQSGSDIAWRLATVSASTALGTSGTVSGRTLGRCSQVQFNTAKNLESTAVGHIAVEAVVEPNIAIAGADLDAEFAAASGETAGARMQRLAGEEGISLRVLGQPDDSEKLGPQRPATLVELLAEAETADLGILYEHRAELGLAYRTRASLYNRRPSLTLDYTAGHIAGLEPVDDDRDVRNDITVDRSGGSSDRRTLDTGALSVLAPPNGVGRYDDSVTVSTWLDEQLPDQAGWRLHLGTVDEARYPTVTVNLASSAYAADAAATTAVLDLDVGDRVDLTHLPAWMPPGDVAQGLLGYTETLGPFTHRLELVCTPASPYEIALFDAAGARYESDGSTLAAGVTATATSLSVSTPAGPLWTTSPADLPLTLLVGGERVQVTAISGSASPQTFTVLRSVNGVVKTHAAGTPIRLLQPAVYSM